MLSKSLPISVNTGKTTADPQQCTADATRCYVINYVYLNPIISLTLGKDTETGARHKKKEVLKIILQLGCTTFT